MLLVDLVDYSLIKLKDHIIFALKSSFVETQFLCAKLGMKPLKVAIGSWWTEPWLYEKKLESHLFGSMGEEECNFDHMLLHVCNGTIVGVIEAKSTQVHQMPTNRNDGI